MTQTKSVPDMLDLLSQPAFYVKDNEIVRVNQAASQLQLQPGMQVSRLLLTGSDEYPTFEGGELYLTLKAADNPQGATVTRIDGYDVFLLEAQHELSELHAMSLAAQELRNPLSTISAVADRLFSSLPAEYAGAAEAQIAQLNRSLYQMLRLVNNMSSAERYSKKTSVPKETCNIHAFFNELFEAAAASTAQGGRTLIFRGLDKDLFCLINKELMERAFYNLLSNAIKFSPVGSVISVSLSRRKNKLYLTMENTADDHTGGHFFDSFLREPGILDGRCGIGLGMVLVRAAAASHGGTVLVEQTSAATKITLSLLISQQTESTVSSPVLRVDYAGERDHRLLELSDALPADAYKNI